MVGTAIPRNNWYFDDSTHSACPETNSYKSRNIVMLYHTRYDKLRHALHSDAILTKKMVPTYVGT